MGEIKSSKKSLGLLEDRRLVWRENTYEEKHPGNAITCMFELPNEIKHLARNNHGSKQLAKPNEVKHPFRVSCRLVFRCRTSHSGLFPTTTRVWCSSWRYSEVHTSASYFTGAEKAATKTRGGSLQSLFSSLSKREGDISQLDVTLPRPRRHRDRIIIGHSLAKKGYATRHQFEFLGRIEIW